MPRSGKASRVSLVTLLVVTALAAMPTAAAFAATLMSEAAARAKAIQILRGDPYGDTDAALAGIIKETVLRRDGQTRACGKKRMPVWEFHVVVDTGNREQFKNGWIDGYLAVDARTGAIVCANLPMLN